MEAWEFLLAGGALFNNLDYSFTAAHPDGTAEVNDPSTSQCSSYGGPFCIYPWYAFNGKADALTYGADYPGTRFDYGKANQFATTPLCGGPFGPDSTYCVTIIKPVPLAH